MYDPAIARFTGVDPIADQFAWVSVYNYAENSPISNIDLHGLQSSPSESGQQLIVTNPNWTGFLQYEARGSLYITGSLAFGVMFDTQGGAALYRTWSAGGGIIRGGSTNWSVGVNTADNYGEMEDWGLNFGVLAQKGSPMASITGGLEINIPMGDKRPSEDSCPSCHDPQSLFDYFDIGVTFAPPLQPLTTGDHLGVYFDISKTTILEEGHRDDILNSLFNKIDENVFMSDLSSETRTLITNWINYIFETPNSN